MPKCSGKRKSDEINDPDYADPECKAKGKLSTSPIESTGFCVVHFDDSSLDSFSQLKEDTLQNLLKIKEARQAEDEGSTKRMDEQCKLLDRYVSERENTQDPGYHRDCYKRFTSHLDGLFENVATSNTPSVVTRSSLPSSSRDRILFDKDCIFCNVVGFKRITKGYRQTYENTCKFAYNGHETVMKIAEEKNDEKLLRRIRGKDLFAVEAHFHPSCRKNYTRPNKTVVVDKVASGKKAAHDEAYGVVSKYIREDLLPQKKIIELSKLKDMYVIELDKTGHSNSDYRANHLKEKLHRDSSICNLISFAEFQDDQHEGGRFKSQLVYGKSIELNTAIK